MSSDLQAIRARAPSSLVAMILGVALLHGLSYAFSGYEAIHQSWKAMGMLFVFSGVMVAVLLVPFQAKKVSRTGRPWLFDVLDNDRTLRALVVVTAVGVAMHLASKLYFISETRLECVTSLHNIWLERPRSGNPAWVELSSRIGHGLSGFAFAGVVSAALATVVRNAGQWRRAALYLTALFFLGQTYAFIIMSRSSMLLLLTGFVAGVVLGVFASGQLRRAAGRVAILIGVAMLVTFGLANVRAYSNIHCLNKKLASVDAVAAEQQGFYRMLPMRRVNDSRSNPFWDSPNAPNRDAADAPGGEDGSSGNSDGQAWFRGLLTTGAESVERLCPSCALVQTYLNHAIWNFEWYASVDADGQGGSLLLKPLRAWYKRLSVDDDGPDDGGDRGFGAGGITLPGALYHDLGTLGVLMGAVLLGLAGRASGALMLGGRWSSALGGILYVFVVGAIGYMFMMPVWSVMAFPFAMGALIVTIGCASIVSHSR